MNGYSCWSDPENIKIGYGLIYCIFDSYADKAYASQRLAEWRTANTTAPLSDVVEIRTSDNNDDKRLAHNMQSRFKIHKTFSSKIGENVNRFLANYNEAANYYNSNLSQKLRYVHNLFDGEEDQYCKRYVQPVCSSFTEACTKMQHNFRSITRQNRGWKYFQNISISSVME